jgi:solute carrier family 25 citrate transporter 1
MYSKPEYATWLASVRTIYAEGGVLRFWRGLLPRMSRIVAATFILNTVRTHTVAHLEAQRADTPH